ncbi:MAG: hypothetical protein A2542_00210 [Parcubacteria group bacterium RIFOXYD2_FULL_52_8]|nr:MAG: hypothetical protein A2542_00210 [Parcubacteria group bacterium RIFOXYD2_FULL_52_8]
MPTAIASLDLFIVAAFFLVVLAIGLYEHKKLGIADYWVNSRKTKQFALVATITSTYVGVGSLISNSGVAFSGAGLMTLMLMGSFVFYFYIFAKFFAPKIKEFGDSAGAYSMPDFLEHKYGKRMRIMSSIVMLITFALSLALQITGMSIFVASIGGFSPTIATLIGGFIVVLYTAVGGLRADIRTDIFQFIVMVTLLVFFTPLLVGTGGGLAALSALPNTFLMGESFAPFYVYILGFLFLGATNLSSPDLWQRSYAGASLRTVRNAMFWGTAFVGLFLLAGTLWGMYGHILLPGATANSVVPELLRALLPTGFYGIVIAAFFAAIMSSADTVLLIMSMTIVHDIYQKSLGKSLTDAQALRMSRWTTLVIGVIAVVLAAVVYNVVHLAIDAVSFGVTLLPAIVYGFYGKHPSAVAAFWSTVVGLVAIVVFLFIDPVQAFIPGVILSFLTYWIISYFFDKKSNSSELLRTLSR